MATFFLDWAGGNDANDGTTFANRWKTITTGATAARIAPGDVIRMKQSAAPTNLGVNGTWTSGNKTVVLASAVNQTISTCDAAWTASANVTDSNSSTKKNGAQARSLAIAAGFTTGLVAYFATGTLDCSAYQQVCFWIRCNAAVVANTFRLDLCSDVAGATPVNSFTITDAHQVGNWLKVVMDNGSALGSSIKSVALVALLDPGTVTVLLDNVFVAKAPGNAAELTLHSLISKANGSGTAVGDVQWWPVMSVDGTTVEIDGGNATNSGSQRGYYGTTETVTTYVRQPVVLAQATTAGGLLGASVQDSGTISAYITFSGGWDSTNMSTQTGDTFLAVNNGFGGFFNGNAKDYVAVTNLHMAGCFNPFSLDGLFPTATDCGAYNCDEQGFRTTGTGIIGAGLTRCVAVANTSQGFNTNAGLAGGHQYISCTAISNSAANAVPGFSASVPLCRYRSCVAYNNGLGGWIVGACNPESDMFVSCLSNGNNGGAVRFSGQSGDGPVRARKCTFSDATVYTPQTQILENGTLDSHDDGNVAGTHKVYGNGFTITNDSSTRHTASGSSAKITLSSAIRTALNPVKLMLAEVSLVANQLATFSCWVRRDVSTSTAILIMPGYQISGADNDVSSTASAAINTWEQLTITFTPTEANVVRLWLYVSFTAGSPNVWVDDLSLAQPQP